MAGLSYIGNLHENKEEERRQKTQKQRRPESENNKVEKSLPPPPLKCKEPTSKVEVDAMKESVSDPDPPRRKRIKLKNKKVLKEDSPTQSNLQ